MLVAIIAEDPKVAYIRSDNRWRFQTRSVSAGEIAGMLVLTPRRIVT